MELSFFIEDMIIILQLKANELPEDIHMSCLKYNLNVFLVLFQLCTSHLYPRPPRVRGYRGHSGAKEPEFNLRCVPAVPWMCRGFNFPLK